jgi:hypothetical protein
MPVLDVHGRNRANQTRLNVGRQHFEQFHDDLPRQARLSDNALIVRNMTATAVTDAIAAGRNGGSWDGPASSPACPTPWPGSPPSPPPPPADLGISTFDGQSVGPTASIVQYTWGRRRPTSTASSTPTISSPSTRHSTRNRAATSTATSTSTASSTPTNYFLPPQQLQPQPRRLSASVTAVPEPTLLPLSAAALLVRRRRPIGRQAGMRNSHTDEFAAKPRICRTRNE